MLPCPSPTRPTKTRWETRPDLRTVAPGHRSHRVTGGPLPYDQGAARLLGQICAAVRAAGRPPRKRSSDLQIAATGASNLLPLYTANPAGFQGTEGLVEIVLGGREVSGKVVVNRSMSLDGFIAGPGDKRFDGFAEF